MNKDFKDEDLMYVLNRCHKIFVNILENKDMTQEELLHVSDLTTLAAKFLKSKLEETNK